ncbi:MULTISPECIES: flavodoxin-dependent (E)-4-hydroxy-3-methylbut-2-enyl-diphosphate synthase [Ruminococcus]|uniref:4-hydroxy-3-methylbut-2-en-1-yl diphosphate synthase (flavodoxin) n=1 Tax=Ruminococcus albus 8 TaxID=246199 RepID=E9SHP0_RUMAL|nr:MULTISPECIES: flavodoxin-dependent (E)-4-hydroxy-3-methylbut-2-enyl-diphosphate synthase [Ruminococcus]EGC01161.1 4-hydroxy-3-methylbut-2-en-1-yl diphosphate synthase [Ruminococcus albus 8]MBE6874100.1 flavodoxin-dependent (E)-4-hydroxy-3-methylbut-2-enyl-diphosphate synthase [Ruminococcus albus]MBR0529923.1 flavodoxin-dependent (E)-4-hydroxy-3-methylbut-2-enyl-diphosphate synthase [Ruminococcus sp.]MCC3349573.1 flavodoxin-dependent (E)-4-hydroxy-3-methylbut-2-enyl-diphosphate synthase [Rumi
MRNVRPVKVGGLTLDGKHIYIQSMLNVPSTDIEGSVEQAVRLEQAGCEIVRAAIPNMEAVALIPAIKEKISIPLVADIHFDYRLALAAADAGIDKIRINPGNIGDMDRVKAVVKKCTEKGIPIRIGVNGGSLEKELLAKYGKPCADALVESAMGHVRILEQCDFNEIVISIKSSDVNIMVEAYRKLSKMCDYPLHLGVTEAGTERMGIIKSAVGIGSLLMDGIGETIRVSLTDEPEKEIYAAKDILKAIGRGSGVQIVSCPTCGRTRIDLIGLAKQVEEMTKNVNKDIKVAVMGCVVNGIGESGEADIGIAGGVGQAVIFAHGKKLYTVSEDKALKALMDEIDKL